MDEALLEVLNDFNKEYGFADLDDGVYFVELNEDTTKSVTTKDGSSSYRLGWRVAAGPKEGREIGDFWRWFRPEEKAQKGARGAIVGALKGILLFVDEANTADAAGAITTLRGSTTEDEATAAIAALVTTFEGVRLPVRLRTNDGGYQNVQYHDRGQPIEADDPAELEAVTV